MYKPIHTVTPFLFYCFLNKNQIIGYQARSDKDTVISEMSVVIASCELWFLEYTIQSLSDYQLHLFFL